MDNNRIANREWLKYIDISLVEIYPIQFANCDRLLKNDAVYIFDEVGSGKTISSGLMALDYLFNNSGRVLIITTNALAKKGHKKEHGQFLQDWYDRLPFEQLKLVDRIDVVNNHYSNLSSNVNYGLVIVDEAQLFLNIESLRYTNLCNNIRAEKIVFLTATPIKSSKNDLYTYVSIARCVTNKDLPYNWIDEINTNNKIPEEIICSTFNVELPVTRYFKDTIMSLNVEGYQKRQARRLMPQLWQYGGNETRNDVLLRMINEKYHSDENNRFVVFTRFVDKEAIKIGELLRNAGFIPYVKEGHNNDVKTYKVVTGSNGYELSDYTGIENLPTVLILTYQIAEQGVNLPGYNYVVNYHVSAFPSALEQRFGRIDRMGKNGSQFAEINMCFLISHDYFDTNTWNFYCAIATYLHNLISYLPSKNTILSEEIIQKYGEAKDYIEAYVEKIKELLNQTEQIDSIIEYFTSLNDEDTEDKSTIECGCNTDLFEFIDENGIEFNTQIEKEEAIKAFRRDVEKALREYSSGLDSKEEFTTERYKELIKKVSDKIFYLEDTKIHTVDAISNCGDNISKQRGYIEYLCNFREQVKLPILVHNYLRRINNFFEKKFVENDFNSLFPYGGYTNIFNQIFEKEDICDEVKQLFISNCNIIITMLPLFKMFSIYERELQDKVYTMQDAIRMRFDFNPFKSAFFRLYMKIRRDSRHLGISKELFNMYFAIPDEYDNRGYKPYCDSEMYYQMIYDKNTEIVQASNWYKLAYHYTRKETTCFIHRKNLCMEKEGNFYKQKEELIQFLAAYYEEYCKALTIWDNECYEYNSAYKIAMDGESGDFNPSEMLAQMGFHGEPEQPEIIKKYENAEMQLHDILNKRDKEKGIHQSLFNHFIFTESGNYREHSMIITVYDTWKVLANDLWTQGIIDEVVGWKYNGCTLNKIAKLPEEFQKYSIY